MNVRDYGAKGDGSADDTAALRAAVAATPPGGALDFPAGRYLTGGTLAINKPITLRGEGTDAYYYGQFGDPYYATVQDAGSVIECHATSGAAIDHTPSVAATLRVHDLHLKGVGDATRTTIGLRIGAGMASGVGCYTSLRGLRVSNFKVGLALAFVLQSAIHDTWLYGCDTGMSATDASNANTFTAFQTTGCGDAVVLTGAVKNVFLGGAIEASTRNGFIVQGEENSLRDLYFEGAAGCLFAVDAHVGADALTLDSCHFGTPGDRVRIAGGACRIFASKYDAGYEIKGGLNAVFGAWPTSVKRAADTTHHAYDGATVPSANVAGNLSAGQVYLPSGGVIHWQDGGIFAKPTGLFYLSAPAITAQGQGGHAGRLTPLAKP